MEDKVLEVDFSNYEQRNAVMQQYGDHRFPFYGENQNGERVSISVSNDSIVLTTYQHNGWIRINHYYINDYSTEEFLDGKWK